MFFCFVIMTDEVLTTPDEVDEVSELKSKNAVQSMQIASLNEQVAKLTKTSSTSNLDEAQLGEWLRADRGGIAPNAGGVLAAEEAIERKMKGERTAEAAAKKAAAKKAAAKEPPFKKQSKDQRTGRGPTETCKPADWRPKRTKVSTRTPWPASVDTSPTSGEYTVESDKWKTKVCICIAVALLLV